MARALSITFCASCHEKRYPFGEIYFVELKDHAVGSFIPREKPETLRINSRAVSGKLKRLDLANDILSYAERIAKELSKKHFVFSSGENSLAKILQRRELKVDEPSFLSRNFREDSGRSFMFEVFVRKS